MMNDTKPKILLVDDDRLAHERLHNLTANRYELHSAYNGQEGMTRALECSPDLILLDVMMPGISGVELLQKIRSSQLGSNPDLPVIMVTARSGSDDINQAISAGAHSYIVKPFRGEEIRSQIADLFSVQEERVL